ncbi:hypothetical protein BV898_00131 [Hypsibius exemplaris]|uniref:HTH CENPB-type domain-containing protein n=1 Tax=Hypsibius exemplaris TaxID=2072580 RepID=A0A1W0XEU1_HYPEX|nr:hypothetical protein BV898_00131 [Hypsibius exemplaris]
MKRICEITKAAYVKVEAELAIIHDADLTKWARDAATSVELSGFRVSKSWILKFKKMHIIVDRKITEFGKSESMRPVHHQDDPLVHHYVDRTVLVIDSWSTYKNQELLDAATPKGREVQIVTVPPKTTPLCQPLDVYGFRL